jgi:peptidoglycan/LPS O-acetylase OafA/YrhL
LPALSFAPMTDNVSFAKSFTALILAGLLFWCCLYSTRVQSFLDQRWLMLLGAISYPLYAIHTAVIEALIYLNHGSGPSALFLRGIILALFAAYGLHRLIEDPVQRWTKKMALQKVKIAGAT